MSLGIVCSALLALVAGKSHRSVKFARTPPSTDSVPTYDPVDWLKAWIPTLDKDWGRRRAGEFYVSNNVWNKGSIGSYRQSVGIRRDSAGAIEAGWAWDWPDKNRAVAFPELVFGKNPWEETSSTDRLPARIADLASLTVEFEFEHDGDGKRGTALQIWLTKDSAASVAGIGQEIMVWLTNDGIPVKGFMAETDIGGAKYALADDADLGRKLEWGYFAFHRATPVKKGTLDLLPFFEFLVGKGLVDKDEYVSSIHLGNEVRGGVGVTQVKKYSIAVENR